MRSAYSTINCFTNSFRSFASGHTCKMAASYSHHLYKVWQTDSHVTTDSRVGNKGSWAFTVNCSGIKHSQTNIRCAPLTPWVSCHRLAPPPPPHPFLRSSPPQPPARTDRGSTRGSGKGPQKESKKASKKERKKVPRKESEKEKKIKKGQTRG